MDIFTSLASFIHRIRYELIVGTTIAVVLTIYFTDFLPKSYNVTSTVFTGITSQSSLDNMSGNRTDIASSNNAHDNIINLVKSKSTMEMVSTHLIAQHLIYGDPNKDTKYISAKHYRDLLRIVPPDVKPLIDKNSLENTVANLTRYRTEDKGNFVYAAFSWTHPYYSYIALSSIKIGRKGNSDMIEISYKSDDPGVAVNTLLFLNQELSKRYESLLLSASNDVVKHFEEQLAIAAQKLNDSEDNLVNFNIEHKIINYGEQTKHLAAQNNSFESRYEEILLQSRSSEALMEELEMQMKTRTKLMLENEIFMNTLSEISTLNGKIAEIEIFGTGEKNIEMLKRYKSDLARAEQKIKTVTEKIDSYKFSKEGVVMDDMVNEWLAALMNSEKTKAELKVMVERKKEIQEQYAFYSPVGPNLGRRDREVRVNEESYLTILHHLGLAKLRQKNILLETGTLQIVTPPEYPLLAMPRRREVYVLAALIGALVFIIGFYLIVDMLDKTIRDGMRAERLTSGKVIGAFPTDKRRKHRRFNDEIRRIAIAYLANSLNVYLSLGKKTTIISLLSIKPGEGKAYIASHLQDYWLERGFTVSHISFHDEINEESKLFLQAQSVEEFMGKVPDTDILIVEYSPLMQSSVPEPLLREAAVNLLILDSERAWMPSDKPIFEKLKKSVAQNQLFIYLNKTDRDAVEQYTGQLPPYTPLRNLSYKLFNFGLTAKR